MSFYLKIQSGRVYPGESHPEQRGHGSSRESRGERCEDRRGFPRWGKSLSFEGTYLSPCHTAFICLKKLGEFLFIQVLRAAVNRNIIFFY